MNQQDKIDMMYKQYKSTKNLTTKKQLYKAIKREEGKRRKEKLDREGIIY